MIMTDFEHAAINAFRAAFLDCEQKGCFFNFSQCVYRNIQANGLQQMYQNNPEFALKIRMIAAIAFVPLDDIVHYFEYLCDNNGFPEVAQQVLDYIEDTWIGHPHRRQVR